MFATAMMPPVFGHHAAAAAPLSPYRPVRPSPLSSSPIRATSPPAASWLLSQHDTQSSPPQPSSSMSPSRTMAVDPVRAVSCGQQASSNVFGTAPAPKNLFRFAARPAKPVPRLQQNRDATRQTRRSLFLNNVRQRADDRAWNRRDCEQELQKLEWWSLEREIRQAREADALATLSEQDIDDAADWMVQQQQQQQQLQPPFSPFPGRRRARHHDEQNYYYDHAEDEDAEMGDDEQLMADRLAAEEEAELEALLASMAEAEAATQAQAQAQEPQTQTAAPATADGLMQPSALRPDSPAFSDDDSYDAIFAELLDGQGPESAGQEAAAGHEDTEMGSA